MRVQIVTFLFIRWTFETSMYTSPLTALQEMIEGSMLAFKLLATFVQAAMHDRTVTIQSFLFDERFTRAEVFGARKGIKRCVGGVGIRC